MIKKNLTALILLTLSTSSYAQVNRCETEASSFTNIWGLGTLDKPTGNKKPSGNTVTMGNLNPKSNGTVAGSGELKNKNGDYYQQNATIIQKDEYTVITHSGYVKSQLPESSTVQAHWVDGIQIALGKDCKLTHVIYPQKWEDCKMNDKGAVVDDCKTKVMKSNKLIVTAEKCARINKLKSDGEVLNSDINKILGSDSQSFQINPMGRHMTTPFESIKANCSKGGLIANYLPTSGAGSNAAREAGKATGAIKGN